MAVVPDMATVLGDSSLNTLKSKLSAGESILDGWTFSATGYSVTSTNSVYLSFNVGTNLRSRRPGSLALRQHQRLGEIRRVRFDLRRHLCEFHRHQFQRLRDGRCPRAFHPCPSRHRCRQPARLLLAKAKESAFYEISSQELSLILWGIRSGKREAAAALSTHGVKPRRSFLPTAGIILPPWYL